MKYIYDPNKDKALVLPIEKIKYKSFFRKEFIINSVDRIKYGNKAIKALGEIDERFKNISEEFRESVISISCYMALGGENLENKSYTELIYPKYTDVMRNICYYQALERTPLTNPNDLSIYEEARDYRLNHSHKDTRVLSPEDSARFVAFKEVSDKNYLKRKKIEEDKEIYDIVEKTRQVLINYDKKKKAS